MIRNQSRAERALSLSETGARSRFSLSASASALNLKKRERELERRPTERARSNTNAIYRSEIKTFGPNLVRHEKVRNCTDDFPNLFIHVYLISIRIASLKFQEFLYTYLPKLA